MTGYLGRRRTSARRALLALTTILSAGLAAPALAQSFRTLDANGVDLVRGDFVMSLPEGSVGSGEAELALLRTGAAPASSQWDGIYFNKSGTGMTKTVTIGHDRITETFTGNLNFASAKANGTTLTKVNGFTYLFGMADGTQITFSDPSGGDVVGPSALCSDYPENNAGGSCTLLPLEVHSADGRTITLDWTPPYSTSTGYVDAMLLSATNSFGYSIQFDYDPAGQRTGSRWYRSGTLVGTTSYSVSGGTTSVTDLYAQTWQVTPTSITRPGESTPMLSVTSPLAVTAATRDGVTTSYARTVSGSTVTTVTTNALGGHRTIVSNTAVGRPSTITDELNRTTSYTYDSAKRLTRVTAPEGNYVDYTLDDRGNAIQTLSVAKPGSGAANIVTSASYPASCTNSLTCNKPTSITGAMGAVTDYTYDAGTGQVTSVKLPAPTAGAVRPETRYSYSGALLTGVSACRTTASCAGTADEVKATLGYDGNGNLTSIARGAGEGSLTATTTYAYGSRGQVASVDGPPARRRRWGSPASRARRGSRPPPASGSRACPPRR